MYTIYKYPYLGNTKIQELYIGSKEIRYAYLGTQLVYGPLESKPSMAIYPKDASYYYFVFVKTSDISTFINKEISNTAYFITPGKPYLYDNYDQKWPGGDLSCAYLPPHMQLCFYNNSQGDIYSRGVVAYETALTPASSATQVLAYFTYLPNGKYKYVGYFKNNDPSPAFGGTDSGLYQWI